MLQNHVKSLSAKGLKDPWIRLVMLPYISLFQSIFTLRMWRGRMYQTNLWAVLLYGCKTWPIWVVFDHQCLISIVEID
ncbi:hypothetical protein T265_13743, partial [Opisthorchis viverrini]